MHSVHTIECECTLCCAHFSSFMFERISVLATNEMPYSSTLSRPLFLFLFCNLLKMPMISTGLHITQLNYFRHSFQMSVICFFHSIQMKVIVDKLQKRKKKKTQTDNNQRLKSTHCSGTVIILLIRTGAKKVSTVKCLT